jgi:hypothetical protein
MKLARFIGLGIAAALIYLVVQDAYDRSNFRKTLFPEVKNG